jgi:uncharacterized protein YwbE
MGRYLDVHEGIILKWILKMDCKDVDFIHLTVDRGHVTGSSQHCNGIMVSVEDGCKLTL